MDPVRFGRVLGTGARLAGRTVAAAVEAAQAPDPRRGGAGAGTGEKAGPEVLPPRRAEGIRAGQELRGQAGAIAASAQGARRGSRMFGEAVWKPFARASGVLWLEVTGVFFGLVALFGLQGVWSFRRAWLGGMGGGAQRHFFLSVGLLAMFGYFCASSFVRAGRRGRNGAGTDRAGGGA